MSPFPRKAGNNTYPIGHISATEWIRSQRAYDLSRNFSDLQKGDLIVWGDTNHVAIFDSWISEENKYANVWESWGVCNEKRHYGIVGASKLTLHTEDEFDEYRAEYPKDDKFHWHIPRRFFIGIDKVFKP